MHEINAGTAEYIVVDVTDELEHLTTLVGATPQYDVIYEETGLAVLSAQTAQVDTPDNLLRLLCLIDTTTGTWPVGEYALFAQFYNGAETPRLGPIRFKVK